MRYNIHYLEDMLYKLRCKFSDLVYISWKKEQYELKSCKTDIDIELLFDYIDVFEKKLNSLRYKFSSNNLTYPSRINRTNIERFYEKDLYLNKCDRKFLEKVKQFL